MERRIKVKDIYPKLSEREKAYSAEKLKWMSGYMYFNLNSDTLYYKLAQRYNHDALTGPSGNTDIQLDIACLFTSFDHIRPISDSY